MTRIGFLGIALLAIVAGLVLRLVPWHLPLVVHHYGGGLLWGAMLFALVASLRPRGWGSAALIAMASILAVAVELIRLIHAPALDAFRATLAGQLFLGRIYSPWNIVAYEIGIVATCAVFGVSASDRSTWS